MSYHLTLVTWILGVPVAQLEKSGFSTCTTKEYVLGIYFQEATEYLELRNNHMTKVYFSWNIGNLRKPIYAMLAAIIPLSIKVDLYPAKLVIVHGIRYDTSKQCYIDHYCE